MNSEFARIHSIETMGMVDGPGIRFVIFFQGCALRCRYCHNPDTWSSKGGQLRSVDSLVEEIMRYEPFFRRSGGGVTATGGDPLLQAPFVARLFAALKKKGIHTALDTAGHMKGSPLLDSVIENTDLVLLDIKHMNDEKHRDLTGVHNRYVTEFARYLSSKKKDVWIRHVILDGHTDDDAQLLELRTFLDNLPNVKRLELLPYHEMGVHKWHEIGVPYTLDDISPPSPARLDEIVTFFADRHYEVVCSH